MVVCEFDFSIFIYGRLNYLFNTGGEGLAARGTQREVDYYTINNPNAEYQKPIYNAGNAPVDPYFTALGYKDASFLMIRNNKTKTHSIKEYVRNSQSLARNVMP